MVPSVPLVLNGLARMMLMELLPQTTHAYHAQTLQLGGALAMMCAQEFDRAAARLSEENIALAALLAEATDIVTDSELRAALRAVAQASTPPSLLVSALQERNRSLRAALIRLHAHVESLDGASARGLEARIWAEIIASTERRRLDLSMA